MKPKEYVKKYQIEETPYFDRMAFVDDILDDFKTMLSAYPKLNTTIFQNCISNINVKWNNIFAGTKIDVESRDKFWNYFFATSIIPVRNIYFPDWKDAVLQHRLKNDPDFARRYNTWKMYSEMDKREREYERFFRYSWEEAFKNRYEEFVKQLKSRANLQYVYDACEFMGIEFANLSVDVVKYKYRQISKMTHPDINSNSEAQSQFVTLSNARDVLIEYLNK